MRATCGRRGSSECVGDEKATLGPNDLREGAVKLSLGRKKHVLLRPV